MRRIRKGFNIDPGRTHDNGERSVVDLRLFERRKPTQRRDRIEGIVIFQALRAKARRVYPNLLKHESQPELTEK